LAGVIILDASVLIGHFEPADLHHPEATALLKAHLTDTFASSVVTLAEVYVGAFRAGQADRLDQLLARLAIRSLELPADAAHRLGELRATTGLKMPDCCVLYTAVRHNAAIATFDDTLAKRAKNIGLTVAAAAG
jgi:predicted nucleic acid-binding protein